MPEIRKVLLVEDEEDIRKVAQISLQFRGNWAVAVAVNGEECLAMAASDPPDLILLDCMMPRMDGYEACRRLKQDPVLSHIPVIFLTAKTQESEIKKGLAVGAVGYLTKPFNPMNLVEDIMKVLEEHQKPD
ncbi:MAG: two-component system response regulator [Acidobacteria bacterium RIFCSPLOWO2_12_FULL_54_10]|nr:MAG: two-component system response regulator [Acidobacteria bacterium RIFCSPLOWO2_12_FULL_54_10]